MSIQHTTSRNYIELFAGCGGLALGLREAGWQGVFAIERDPMAFETFSNNMLGEKAKYRCFEQWPDWLPKTNHDIISLLANATIRNQLSSLKGTVALVAGGPPCQGFSVGGRRDGTDERNSLVFSMLDLVGLVEPKIVFIENVEGIAKKFLARPGETSSSIADIVTERLTHLGYTSTYSTLESVDFGVPQLRKRIGIVGIKNSSVTQQILKETFVKSLEKSSQEVRQHWNLPLDRDITALEALHDLHGGAIVQCPDSPKFTSSTYAPSCSEYSSAMRKGCKSGDIPNSHRFSQHGKRILDLYKLAHKTQKPGRLSKSFLLENGTKKDKKVLIDPASPVSTITTHPDEFIHYLEHRNITVREMARLQSFPDDFLFYGRYTINGPCRKIDVARCSQVGNAVPPLMAHGIGLCLLDIIGL